MDMDVDGDQLINLTEFRYFVKGLGLNLDQVEILNLFQSIDVNGDQKISR